MSVETERVQKWLNVDAPESLPDYATIIPVDRTKDLRVHDILNVIGTEEKLLVVDVGGGWIAVRRGIGLTGAKPIGKNADLVVVGAVARNT